MANQYIFDPIAATEYEDAFMSYQEKSTIAAESLIVAVQEAIEVICLNPYRYRNTHINLRELSLKNIPST